MHITNAISSARYRERVFYGGFAAQVLGQQRTFGIENMGTPDAVVILNKVRYHTNTGLRRITEDLVMIEFKSQDRNHPRRIDLVRRDSFNHSRIIG